MAPVSQADKAALEGFFQSRRGQKVLIVATQTALVQYFAQKGTTLSELPLSRPANASDLAGWVGGLALMRRRRSRCCAC